MPLYTFVFDLSVDRKRVDLSAPAATVDLKDEPARVQIDLESPPIDRLTWNGVPIVDRGEYLIDPD